MILYYSFISSLSLILPIEKRVTYLFILKRNYDNKIILLKHLINIISFYYNRKLIS